MQIEKIEIQSYRLKFEQKFTNAKSSWSDRPGYVIKMTSSSGLVGLGEAAPLPNWSPETLTQTAIALEQISRHLQARPITLEDLATVLLPHQAIPSACHGIELAYLDLLTQSQQLPLCQWLNPTAKMSVPVNGLLTSSPNPIAKAQTLVAQGYNTLKLKIGRNWQQDLALIQALRQRLGHQIRLRLDLNQAWHLEQAIARIAILTPWQIEYLEQPLTAQDLPGMAKLRQLQQIPIAADESAQTLEQLHTLLQLQAADIVILKPMILGGILATYKAAQLAIHAGITPIITTTLDSAIARAAAIHLAAALPERGHADGLATGQFFAADLFLAKDLWSERSPITLANQPGLGLDWRNLRL